MFDDRAKTKIGATGTDRHMRSAQTVNPQARLRLLHHVMDGTEVSRPTLDVTDKERPIRAGHPVPRIDRRDLPDRRGDQHDSRRHQRDIPDPNPRHDHDA